MVSLQSISDPFKRTLLILHIMGSISYGVELELLVRPRLEDEDVVKLFESCNWMFGKLLDRKERTNNNRILHYLNISSTKDFHFLFYFHLTSYL